METAQTADEQTAVATEDGINSTGEQLISGPQGSSYHMSVLPMKRLSKQEKKELRKIKMIESRHNKYDRQKARKKQKALEQRQEEKSEKLITSDETSAIIVHGPRKRDLLLQRLADGMRSGINICIDLMYDEEIHNERERVSLVKQLIFCYSYLKQSNACIHLHLASISPLSSLTEKLHRMGFENWLASRHQEHTEQFWDPRRIVILSPDAIEVLDTLEEDKIYVIGGIVDRTVRKSATLKTAETIGAESRRLPLKEHLGSMVTHILNVDHVFRILCDYQETKVYELQCSVTLNSYKH